MPRMQIAAEAPAARHSPHAPPHRHGGEEPRISAMLPDLVLLIEHGPSEDDVRDARETAAIAQDGFATGRAESRAGWPTWCRSATRTGALELVDAALHV